MTNIVEFPNMITPESGIAEYRAQVLALGGAMLQAIDNPPMTYGDFTAGRVESDEWVGVIIGRTDHFNASTLMISEGADGLNVSGYMRRASDESDAEILSYESTVSAHADTHLARYKQVSYPYKKTEIYSTPDALVPFAIFDLARDMASMAQIIASNRPNTILPEEGEAV